MKPFKKNDYPTLGIEEELHLINPETAELTPSVNEVMVLLDTEFRKRICYELQRALCKNLNGDLVALEKELATRTLDFSV